MANVVSKNKIDRFVQSKKIDYKVPEFLLDKLENVPAPEEFLKKYSTTQEQTPLWWTRDVDLPLTKKENRRSRKQVLAVQRNLEQQQIRLEVANQQYQKLLQKQEKEFKKRCQELDKQVELKNQELEMLYKNNKLEYKNKLMELELELQQANREKQYYEREQKRLKELEDKKKKLEEEQQEWQQTLADIDDEIRKHFEEKQSYKSQVLNELSKDSESENIPQEDKQDIFPDDYNICSEKFDPENILEVRHITLTNSETGYNELYNISFNVKKTGVTVVYSKSQRLLQGLEMAIIRALPSNMSMTSGQIRLKGEDICEILRRDYRKRAYGLMISLSDIEDKLSRTAKKSGVAMKGYEIDQQKLNEALELLGLEKSIKKRKLSKIKAEQKDRFALALLFATDIGLKIMYEPQQDITEEEKEILFSLINKNSSNQAQLILTSDKKLALRLDNSSLYTL